MSPEAQWYIHHNIIILYLLIFLFPVEISPITNKLPKLTFRISFGVAQSPSSAFDLGAFVGDLTIEEDLNGLIYCSYHFLQFVVNFATKNVNFICFCSDDISLEGLQQELEECKNDEVSNCFNFVIMLETLLLQILMKLLS